MAVLYVVATPIGNLSDLTPRAAEVLKTCDLVAAEDTRVTMKLLSVLGVSKPMVSCHRHNEDNRARHLVDRMLAEDLTVALCSDAGTPAISDPGQFLVDEAWTAGIHVIPVPGASAVPTALSAAGFDARKFAFFGFMPREDKALDSELTEISKFGPGCAVLYESPHRIVKLMQAVARKFPDIRTAVMCDLTKKFERIYRGAPHSVLEELEANANVEKGEYCVVLEMPEPVQEEAQVKSLTCELEILQAMLDGADMREACEAASANWSRNEIYKAKLKIKSFLEEE